MINQNVKLIILFIGLVFVQFLFLNDLLVLKYGFCFIYIAFILLLPVETPPLLALALAFIIGFVVDIFANTLGVNAAATVLVGFVRPLILKLVTPRGGYDAGFVINPFIAGWQWFLSYSFVMILIHHLVLFSLEAMSLELIGSILLRTLFSSILTLIILVFGQLIFSAKR